MVAIVTNRIYPDEPCYGLFEGPDHGRWVQKIFVIRSDSIARWQKDLGPEENYERVMPLLMPSFGDDSVAQLQAFAEKNRQDDYWAKRRDEMLAASTLVQDHLDLLEQDLLLKANRSVFGPKVNVQRFRHPGQYAARRIKEKLNGN
jgi:hypothetical protein